MTVIEVLRHIVSQIVLLIGGGMVTIIFAAAAIDVKNIIKTQPTFPMVCLSICLILLFGSLICVMWNEVITISIEIWKR